MQVGVVESVKMCEKDQPGASGRSQTGENIVQCLINVILPPSSLF